MHWILAITAGWLALADGAFTIRRMHIHPSLERNPLVCRLASHTNPVIATLVGVVGIQLIITAALALVSNLIPLAIFTGMGLYRTIIQLDSLTLERQILAPKAVDLPALRSAPRPQEEIPLATTRIGARHFCGEDI